MGKMGINFGIVPTLFFFFFFFCCFVPLIPTSNSQSAINTVCNTTIRRITGTRFCRDTVTKGNPMGTNRIAVASRVFGKAYKSAHSVKRGIVKNVKKTAILEACLRYYKGAENALGSVLADMITDEYCYIKPLSREAYGNVTACQKLCKGTNILADENALNVKLTEICKAVSDLFGKCG